MKKLAMIITMFTLLGSHTVFAVCDAESSAEQAAKRKVDVLEFTLEVFGKKGLLNETQTKTMRKAMRELPAAITALEDARNDLRICLLRYSGLL